MATKSKVNSSGNYTQPGMRKKLFSQIKSSATQGTGAHVALVALPAGFTGAWAHFSALLCQAPLR